MDCSDPGGRTVAENQEAQGRTLTRLTSAGAGRFGQDQRLAANLQRLGDEQWRKREFDKGVGGHGSCGIGFHEAVKQSGQGEVMEIFEIASDRLAGLYPELKCDGCGKLLQAEPVETWAKAGCGYFCADCLAKGVYLSHPACGLR